MPIYAYKCDTCGHTKDVLQKISDAPLSVCPACGAATFTKQVTAAGFQLKGSGWYVTDFRDSGKGVGKSAPASEPAAEGAPCAATESGKDGAASTAVSGSACASCPAAAAGGGSAPQA